MAKKAINPIKNGTVIDHIPAGQGLNVLRMLNLPPSKEKRFVGENLSSTKFGLKDILMFENVELAPEQLSAIALIAPQATISIIKQGEIMEKRKVTLPDFVEGIIVCPNPKCITNIEKVGTRFDVGQDGIIEVQCRYCEKRYPIDGVKIKM